jgi:hypothetical protein
MIVLRWTAARPNAMKIMAEDTSGLGVSKAPVTYLTMNDLIRLLGRRRTTGLRNTLRMSGKEKKAIYGHK